VRARRVPNWLTGSLALAAILVHAFGGLRAAAISLAVMAVLVAAGTLLYSRGGIGGGDIKLAIAASGMLSFPLCIPFLIYAAIGGGLLAVAYMLTTKSKTMPYALAFAFGAVVVALSQSVAPFLRINL
jgi:prepilin peptidase CpaA